MFNTTDPPPRNEGNSFKRPRSETFRNIGVGVGGFGAAYAGLRVAKASEAILKSSPAYAGSKLRELMRKFWQGKLRSQRLHSLLREIRFALPGEMTGLLLPETEQSKSRPWKLIRKAALQKEKPKQKPRIAMTPAESTAYEDLVSRQAIAKQRLRDHGASAEEQRELAKKHRKQIADFPVTTYHEWKPPKPNIRLYRSAAMATDITPTKGEYLAEREKLQGRFTEEKIAAAGSSTPEASLEKVTKQHNARVNKLKQRLYPTAILTDRRAKFRQNIASNFATVSPKPGGGFSFKSTGIRQILQARKAHLAEQGITEEVAGKGLIGSYKYLRSATPEQRKAYDTMISGLQKSLSGQVESQLKYRETRAGQLVAAAQKRARRTIQGSTPGMPGLSEKEIINRVQRATMAPPHESQLPYRGTTVFKGGLFKSTTPLQGEELSQVAKVIGVTPERAARMRRQYDYVQTAAAEPRIRSQILKKGSIFDRPAASTAYQYSGFKKLKRLFRFEDKKQPVQFSIRFPRLTKAGKKELLIGGALTGGITAADMAISGIWPDKDKTRGQSILAGAKRGAVYGGVLSATEPLIRRAFTKHPARLLMNAKRKEIEFNQGLKRFLHDFTSRQMIIRFQEGYNTPYNPKRRLTVAQDKYRKLIRAKEIGRKEGNLVKSAAAGAALAAALGHRSVGGLAVGAGAGLAAETGLIVRGRKHRDVFGEENISSKRIERIPWQAGGLAAAGIAGRALYKGAKKMGPIGGSSLGSIVARAGRSALKHSLFSVPGKEIQFQDDTDLDKVWGRKWQKQYLPRRYEEVKTKVGRGKRLIRDIARKAKGDKFVDPRGREQIPEWKKPWVRNVVLGAAFTGLVGGTKLLTSGLGKKPFRRTMIRAIRGPHRPSGGELEKSLNQYVATGVTPTWKLRPQEGKVAKSKGVAVGFPSGGYPVGSPMRKIGEAHNLWRRLKRDVAHASGEFVEKIRLRGVEQQIAEKEKKATEALKKTAQAQGIKLRSRLKEIRLQVERSEDWRTRPLSTHQAVVSAPGIQLRKPRRKKEGLEIKRNRDIAAGAAIIASGAVGTSLPYVVPAIYKRIKRGPIPLSAEAAKAAQAARRARVAPMLARLHEAQVLANAAKRSVR